MYGFQMIGAPGPSISAITLTYTLDGMEGR
jgi:hypothetical protein